MQIQLEALVTNLKNKLAPVYLLHGDELLLIQEARKTIRQAAAVAGFKQRQLLQVDTGFDWAQFNCLTQNYGLFADKTMIEILNPTGKFDEKGLLALKHYLNTANKDTIVVICTGKLTAAQQKTRWYKAIAKAGITIPIRPIAKKDLPAWIKMRMQQANLSADWQSIQLLANLTEGNLLATFQAILKLQLLFPDQNKSITQKEVLLAVADSARYNVFDLVNYILQGNAQQVIRILARLRQEGIEATLILWALSREIRHLMQLCLRLQKGESLSQVVQKEWYSQQVLLKQVLPQHNLKHLNACLQHAYQIDQMIKGIKMGEIWDNLLELSLALALTPLFKHRNTHV